MTDTRRNLKNALFPGIGWCLRCFVLHMWDLLPIIARTGGQLSRGR